MKADPSNPHLPDPAAVWMNFAGVLARADLGPAGARLNREDLPWVELTGPMRHGGHARDALFTGRRLQQWLAEIQARSAGAAAELGAPAQKGLETGALTAEFALLLSEGREAQARAAQERLRPLLPGPVFRALFGP